MTDTTSSPHAHSAVAYDCCVMGQGPAGRLLTYRLAQCGHDVTAIEPRPAALNTYGVFLDEVPDWFPKSWIHAVSTPLVLTDEQTFTINRSYAMLDSEQIAQPVDGVTYREQSAEPISDRLLAVSDQLLHCRNLFDARGQRDANHHFFQLAVGIEVPLDVPATAHPIVREYADIIRNGHSVWMDFRSDRNAGRAPLAGADDSFSYWLSKPTFTYVMPVPGGMLIEETILAVSTDDPSAGLEMLASKLQALTGLELNDYPVEKVVIPLAGVTHEGYGTPIGARAGWMQPISGYSVATAAARIDRTLDEVLPSRRWQRKHHDSLNVRGRLARLLRLPSLAWKVDTVLTHRALQVLVHLDSEELPYFLEPIFQISPERQRRFFARGDVWGTVSGMWRVFATAPWKLRAKIVVKFFGTPTPPEHQQ